MCSSARNCVISEDDRGIHIIQAHEMENSFKIQWQLGIDEEYKHVSHTQQAGKSTSCLSGPMYTQSYISRRLVLTLPCPPLFSRGRLKS